MDITRARRRRAERLRRCGTCGRKLDVGDHRREPIGLIEDGWALCRSCAVEADREYDTSVFGAA